MAGIKKRNARNTERTRHVPIVWDIGLSIVAGFAFSSLKPMIKNARGKDVNEKHFFVLGLAFNESVVFLVSVRACAAVDPNWLVRYWANSRQATPSGSSRSTSARSSRSSS